ncbi:MAG: type II secretion system F family protein [Phycisphaerae bacterium]|nr:type II secretion system F family protein [Phycisphaerae bacterium]
MLTGAIAVMLLVYIFLAAKMPRTAVLTMPVTAIGFLMLSASEQDVLAVFMAFLMVATTLIALATLSPREKRNWARKAAIWTLRLVAAIPALALAGVLWPLTVLLMPVFVTLFLRYYFVARHSTALFVISTIGACMRQNLPLAMALETAAANAYDKRSRVLRSISSWLVQGYALSEAIKRGYRACPAHAVGAIAAAEKIGQLPEALRCIEADMVQLADETKKIRPVDWSYPFMVLAIMSLIVTGLMIYIIPTFAEVLNDMSDGATGLPYPTQLLLNTISTVMHNYAAVGVLMCCVTWTLGAALWVRFRPRRPEKPYLLSRVGDFVKWHIPVARWFEKNYSMLQAVALMRVSLRAGATVDQAIRGTLGLDTNCRFRICMARWLERVERGDNVAAAAKSSGVPKALAYAFDTDTNGGTTTEILQVLEEFYRSSYNFRANVAKAVAVPVMVVGLGAMVGLVIYAMFVPMNTMLWVMMSDLTP